MASISDNFNRANEALDAGPWVIVGGDSWSVSSNQAVATSVSAHGTVRHTSQLDGSDQRVEAKWISGQGGVLIRANSTITTGYFVAIWSAAIRQIFKITGAGTADEILGSLDISMSSGDTVYMEIEGTAIRVGKIGGAEESTTDASYATGTFVGMYSQTAVVTLDDWSAEDLGGGGPILMPRAIHVAG